MSTKSELARAARTLRAATARRNLLIGRMRSEGATLREIGAAAQLTHAGVMLILKAGPGEGER